MSSFTVSRSRPFGVAAILLACATAEAAPQAARGAAEPEIATSPVTASPAAKPGVAWSSGDSEPAHCDRARRKLWQAGEGWVVKTVTLCR